MRRRSQDRECRSAYRIEVPGASAIGWSGQTVARYDISNFSRSGALLRDGKAIPVGDGLHLAMVAPGFPTIMVAGRVTRHLEDGQALAVAFDDLDPIEEDIIGDLVLAALLRRRTRWR